MKKRLAALTLAERGPSSFDTWNAPPHVDKRLGEFEVALLTDVDTAPDEAMLRLADELIEIVTTRANVVVDLIYAGYVSLSKADPDWVTGCGVPLGLRKSEILGQLLPENCLTVTRFSAFEPPYLAKIHFVPRWDEEHAFELKVEQGRIVSVNGSPLPAPK